jgi:hypothetical protein
MPQDIRYKFVELSTVTDESIETAVNEWVGQGWILDRIHFAMREGSHRPAMAFIAFIRDVGNGAADEPH